MKRHESLASQRRVDALELLTREQLTIGRHFRDYERLMRRRVELEQKAAVVGRICDACCLHLQLKEELLHPLARSLLHADPMLGDLLGEHADSRELIARLDEMEPQDGDYDTTVAALADCLLPQLDAEQKMLFPRLRSCAIDLESLGRQLWARRRELQSDVTQWALGRSPTAAIVLR